MTAIATKSYRPAQGIWSSYTTTSDVPSRTLSGLDNSFRPIGHEAAPPPSLLSSATVSPPLARPQPVARHPPPKRGARRFLADLFRRRTPAPSPTPYVPPVMRVATDGHFGLRRGATSSPLSDDDHSAGRVTASASDYHGRRLSRVNATRDISFHRSSAPRRRSRPASRNMRITSEFGIVSPFDFETSDVYPRSALHRADDIRRFDSGRATGGDIRRFDSVRTPQRFDSQHAYPSREPSAFEMHRDGERYDASRVEKWLKPTAECRGCAGRTTWRREQMHSANCPRAKRSPMEESRAGTPMNRRRKTGEGFAQRHMSWEGGAKLMRKLSRHRPERGEGKRGTEEFDLGFMQMNGPVVRPIPPWSGDDVMSSVSRGSESNEEHY